MLRRTWTQFAAFAAITVKERLAFNAYFWTETLGQLVLMIIAVHFWRAVYSATPMVGGMDREQAVAYVLVANSVGMVISWSLIPEFGTMLRTGAIAHELVRPLDFQFRMFAKMFAMQGATALLHMLLLGGVATLFLGLRLPVNPLVWLWFALSLVSGFLVLFTFDWLLSISAFYTTEIRGLYILREGLASFFSGYMVPLAMLPDWIRHAAELLPFGQVLNTPVQILTGVTPLGAAPRAVGVQLLWAAVLLAAGRPALRVALRSVAVQGG
ncbi:MAG TPA: ABC-2 family transporter protein [Symbiobacteriaceae bacterium]|nr:ABC-2 family transporter protein [Symbiobacteriaceae bacterium]